MTSCSWASSWKCRPLAASAISAWSSAEAPHWPAETGQETAINLVSGDMGNKVAHGHLGKLAHHAHVGHAPDALVDAARFMDGPEKIPASM